MSILSIHNIFVETTDKTQVVKGVSMKVKPGEVHIIMGRNGSGKSSLVNAVMGHPKYTITKGTVTLGKQNVIELTPEQKAQHGLFLSMQYVPKVEGVTLAYFLHKVHTSLTNERIPIMDYYAQAVDAAKALGIPESFLKRPIHAGLSGGEKKQSEILQLYMMKPKFAFLDEVDSGVDVTAMKKVFAGMSKLKELGTSLVLITHYPDILKRLKPDVVHIMADGKILETGGSELVKKIATRGF
jgi:Fe-S cluster assembly ATP-binding protein